MAKTKALKDMALCAGAQRTQCLKLESRRGKRCKGWSAALNAAVRIKCRHLRLLAANRASPRIRHRIMRSAWFTKGAANYTCDGIVPAASRQASLPARKRTYLLPRQCVNEIRRKRVCTKSAHARLRAAALVPSGLFAPRRQASFIAKERQGFAGLPHFP
jgi:hypothetical protein